MPTVIPVKFKYAARDLWFSPADTGAQEGDHVICTTERGLEIGLAVADAHEVTDEELAETIGHAQLRDVLRIATDADLDHAEELADKGDAAMPAFRRLVAENGLDMKPVGVEYLFDGDKAVCYFASEDRVDFRQLVRDLSRELHQRIDMRQIGVREEAAVVGGYGHCGQELCCQRFGLSFEPVSIRMAKEQDLPLNSTKISGACGRLMCCLRYEFEAYRDFKGRAPKRNAVIDTPLGKGKIVEYDTPKEQICLRLENGKQIRVALADMTASEAAVKKSEELGCACRPDTVARDVLNRLQSPDVQMALAELDRKNGVTPVETVDQADIFVETKRKRRRGSAQGGQGAEAPAAQARPAASPAEGESTDEVAAPSRRRRHKNRGSHAAQQGEAAGQEPRTSEQSASPAPEGEAPSSRRRRHHHAADSGVDATPTDEQAQQSAPKHAAKRTRHPGDRGGAASQQQPKPKNPAPQAQQGDGEAKPKRRRHRGPRGNGDGSGSNGGAAEGGAPSAE
jgi:cell fate regulator YaaT (PSP1 superfamily)